MRTIFAAAALAGSLLGPAPSALGSPERTETQSPAMAMIHDAVEETKHDASALAFAVCLPDDESDASRTIDTWSSAASDLSDETPVFMLTGADRDEVMDLASISRTPAFIAYRDGMPAHTRTGCATRESLAEFIGLAQDPDTAPSYSADQTRVLYDDMRESLESGAVRAGAEHGCMLMLTLHAFTDGPYGASFGACERTRMDAMYNESLMRVAAAARTDPHALAMLEQTAATAKRTWDAGANGHLGIALWIDLAEPAGHVGELLAWADSSETDARAAEALALEGARIRPILIEHERWGALARSVRSADQIRAELEDASRFARTIIDDGLRDVTFAREHKNEMTRVAALVHAALLREGRAEDAWAIASTLTDFSAKRPAAEALCRAALELGVETPRHTALAGALDHAHHADLLDRLPRATANVTGALTED